MFNRNKAAAEAAKAIKAAKAASGASGAVPPNSPEKAPARKGSERPSMQGKFLLHELNSLGVAQSSGSTDPSTKPTSLFGVLN